LQKSASVTERVSIELTVTEEHLKSGTFEINPGQRDIIRKKRGCPAKAGTNGNPDVKVRKIKLSL
jgi:hypothetical protein